MVVSSNKVRTAALQATNVGSIPATTTKSLTDCTSFLYFLTVARTVSGFSYPFRLIGKDSSLSSYKR